MLFDVRVRQFPATLFPSRSEEGKPERLVLLCRDSTRIAALVKFQKDEYARALPQTAEAWCDPRLINPRRVLYEIYKREERRFGTPEEAETMWQVHDQQRMVVVFSSDPLSLCCAVVLQGEEKEFLRRVHRQHSRFHEEAAKLVRSYLDRNGG